MDGSRMLNFVRSCRTAPQVVVVFCILVGSERVPVAPSSPAFGGVSVADFFAILVNVHWYFMVGVVLRDVEHLLMGSLASSVSSALWPCLN